jgi:hypothetical protein
LGDLITGHARFPVGKVPLAVDGTNTILKKETAVVNRGQFPFIPPSVYGRILRKITVFCNNTPVISMHGSNDDVDGKYLDRLISVIAYRVCTDRRSYEEFPVLSPGEFTKADVEFIRTIQKSTRISSDTRDEICAPARQLLNAVGLANQAVALYGMRATDGIEIIAGDEEIHSLHGEAGMRAIYGDRADTVYPILRETVQVMLGMHIKAPAVPDSPSVMHVNPRTTPYRSQLTSFMNRAAGMQESPNYANFGVILY